MGKKMIPINGKALADILKERKIKQKDIDEYLGYSKAIGNYIHRNEISVSVKDALELKFGIKLDDYAKEKKNECLFCYLEENGDIPLNREPICDESVDIGYQCIKKDQNRKNALELLDCSVSVFENIYEEKGIKDGYLSIYLEEYKPEGDDFNGAELIDDRELITVKLNFNYCPMCGRKLRKGE